MSHFAGTNNRIQPPARRTSPRSPSIRRSRHATRDIPSSTHSAPLPSVIVDRQQAEKRATLERANARLEDANVKQANLIKADAEQNALRIDSANQRCMWVRIRQGMTKIIHFSNFRLCVTTRSAISRRLQHSSARGVGATDADQD